MNELKETDLLVQARALALHLVWAFVNAPVDGIIQLRVDGHVHQLARAIVKGKL